jgi:DnaJ-class molecular chaperone
MHPKKPEELNAYEILNISPSASQQEIAAAYRVAKTAYDIGALASYGLASEDERRTMQGKIEEAYHTLRSTRRRQSYDRRTLRHETASQESAYFRVTTDKLTIEDGGESPGLWKKIKRLLFGNKT